MLMVAYIEQKELFTSYDVVKRMFFISYPAVVTADVITQIYDWLHQALSAKPVIEGIVFDFQHVQRFDASNLAIIEQQSHALSTAHDMRLLPVALVVKSSYQQRLVEQIAALMPPALHTSIFQTINEVFPFMRQFRAIHGLPVNAADPTHLNTDEVSGWHDATAQISYFVYYGEVTPNVTADVYEYIGASFQQNGTGFVKGGLYDFRHVTGFQNANLNTVRRTSGALNTNYDMSHIAVGLIVSSILQERMVLLAMKVTPQEKRKKIVYGYQEGLDFIRTFHARRTDTLEQINPA
jgi:hypothetical protein